MTIWALHGFLGLPSDFDQIQQHLYQRQPGISFQAVDYLYDRQTSPQVSLSDWGDNFNQLVRRLSKDAGPHVLMGYSQGGRLALHALQAEPQFWSGCILMSAGIGITETEKAARIENDNRWANRFLSEDFGKTLRSWNSQTVFQNSAAEPERLESRFNRRQLADCLINWSVSRQQNFMHFLKQAPVPVLYLSGEFDSRYTTLGIEMASLNHRIENRVVSSAAHRVLFDQPQITADLISQWLKNQGLVRGLSLG